MSILNVNDPRDLITASRLDVFSKIDYVQSYLDGHQTSWSKAIKVNQDSSQRHQVGLKEESTQVLDEAQVQEVAWWVLLLRDIRSASKYRCLQWVGPRARRRTQRRESRIAAQGDSTNSLKLVRWQYSGLRSQCQVDSYCGCSSKDCYHWAECCKWASWVSHSFSLNDVRRMGGDG